MTLTGSLLGITTDDILNLIGEIPKDTQVQEIENAPMPQFLKDRADREQQQHDIRRTRGKQFPEICGSLHIETGAEPAVFPGDIPAGDHHCQSTDVCREYNRGTAGARSGEPYCRGGARTAAGSRDSVDRISYHDAGVYD